MLDMTWYNRMRAYLHAKLSETDHEEVDSRGINVGDGRHIYNDEEQPSALSSHLCLSTLLVFPAAAQTHGQPRLVC